MKYIGKTFAVVLIIACVQHSFGQRKLEYGAVSFGNAASSMPFTGITSLFEQPYHPYLNISSGFTWSDKAHSRLEQSFNIGVIYHQFVQTTIPLFAELIYARKSGENWLFKSHLGAGYLHSIPGTDRFELNADGEYEKIKGIGRAQGMFRFALSMDRKIAENMWLMFNYGLIMQGPFVKSYVTVLPYNTLQVGLKYQINRSDEQ